MKFRARYYDYDNGSPRIELPGYVRMDAVWEDVPPGGSPDGAVDFDEYDDNEWIVYSARLGFQASEHIRAGIRFQHDEFETNRFSRDGVAPYLPGALILDFNDGDYDADLLMVDMTMIF